MQGIAKQVIPFLFFSILASLCFLPFQFFASKRKVRSESLIRIVFRNNACPIVFHQSSFFFSFQASQGKALRQWKIGSGP